MKLTEGWGEAKNYSKGEDDGFKMEEGEGEGRGTKQLLPQNTRKSWPSRHCYFWPSFLFKRTLRLFSSPETMVVWLTPQQNLRENRNENKSNRIVR